MAFGGESIFRTGSRNLSAARDRHESQMDVKRLETEDEPKDEFDESTQLKPKDEFEETETEPDTEPLPPPDLAQRIVRTIARGSRRPQEHDKYVKKVPAALQTIAYTGLRFRGKFVIPGSFMLKRRRTCARAKLHGNFRLG